MQYSAPTLITILYVLMYSLSALVAVVFPDLLRIAGGDEFYVIRDWGRVARILMAAVGGLLLSSSLARVMGIKFRIRSIESNLVSKEIFQPFRLDQNSGWFCLITAAFFLAMEIYRQGLSRIFSREEYIPDYLESNGFAAFSWLVLLVPALCALYTSSTPNLFSRVAQFLIMGAYLVLQFGSASKKLAVGIAIYGIVYFVVKARRPTLFNCLIYASLFVCSYNFALNARGYSEHGVLNYLKNPIETLKSMLDYAPPLATIADTITSLDATLQVYDFAEYRHLAIDLSPLPGALVGWHDLFPELRLSNFAPFCSVGEIGAFGWLITFIFYFILGLASHTFEYVIGRFSTRPQISVWLFRFFILAFALFGIQYNLRSSFRFVYSGFAAASVLAFLPDFTRKRFSPREFRGHHGS